MTGSARTALPVASLVLIGIGVLCLLIVHFVIFQQTGASAFINQPQFYYNRFIIRDGNGQWVRDVSLKVGYASYLTAGLALALIGMGAVLVLKRRRKADVSDHALDGAA